MFDPKQFEDLARKLYTALPTSLQNFENEFNKNLKKYCNRLLTAWI